MSKPIYCAQPPHATNHAFQQQVALRAGAGCDATIKHQTHRFQGASCFSYVIFQKPIPLKSPLRQPKESTWRDILLYETASQVLSNLVSQNYRIRCNELHRRAHTNGVLSTQSTVFPSQCGGRDWFVMRGHVLKRCLLQHSAPNCECSAKTDK